MMIVHNNTGYLPGKFDKFQHVRYDYLTDGDYGLFLFDVEIIRDNQESFELVELCARYEFDYHFISFEEFEVMYDDLEGFFQTPEQATADLEFLYESLLGLRDVRITWIAGYYPVCVR